MSTIVEARDAVLGVVNTGWLADPLTTSLTMLWDDVEGDKPGFDANNKPVAYGRTTMRHGVTTEETIGGEGLGKDQHSGFVTVQCFGPKGRGYTTAAAIAQVVKGFFQRKTIPGVDGWFFNVSANEVEVDGDHDMVNVTAQFRYSERV